MKLGGILAIILAVGGTAVAQDVNVIGATSHAIPEVSVVGAHTVEAGPSATPDIAVAGGWTMDESSAAATRTLCYETSDGVPVATAQPTNFEGETPQGYRCYAVYSHNGGVMYSPLSSAEATRETSNKAITVGLPVVVSVVGLIALVGAFIVYRRYRARQGVAAAMTTGGADGKHAWVNRPGGWAKDETTAENGQATKY
ncbi:hypothetical protein FRC17_003528 [Serendipita sp. 399]|nr:hypothetical protein FRC17_003528 [Serendipita sp. 399]